MEWVILFGLIIGFGTINEKLEKLKKQFQTENRKLNFKNYLGKPVSLIVNNENISDSYLFTSISSTIGIIKDYDREWLLFEYQKNKKTIEQYIRISDITSINEIKK